MAVFQVRDLMINVVDARLNRQGGNFLCLQDRPTQATCGLASPVMHVVRVSPLVQKAADLAVDGVRRGDRDLAANVNELATEIGHQMIAGAVIGKVGRPDPNCGGTSLETIPTPLTPVVSKGTFLQASDLATIKEQVQEVSAIVDELSEQFAPSAGLETEVVVEHLNAAVETLAKRKR